MEATATRAGRPVSGYTVARYASASGGTKVPAGGNCVGTVTAGLGCTDQGVPTGAWYYTVTPVLAQWQGAESVRSSGAAVDTTPPAAPAVAAPAYVNIDNVSSVPVSGTTEPGASIALAVTDAGAAHTVNATVTANGSGAWNATVNLTSLNAGTVNYRAVATDTAGNQGNPATPGTATSVKDVTAPTVTGVLLADGGGRNGKLDSNDKATITFSERLDASTICSGWAADPSETLTLTPDQPRLPSAPLQQYPQRHRGSLGLRDVENRHRGIGGQLLRLGNAQLTREEGPPTQLGSGHQDDHHHPGGPGHGRRG